MKVVYFGTPQFAANVLSFLINHGIDIVGVVTKPDKAKGRSQEPVPTPVKSVALTSAPHIQVLQPAIVSDLENVSDLKKFEADLFVVVAYGEIIKQHLLEMPKLACINLHASLLPKYRGAAPIQRSIIEGETLTGLSVIHMAKKMDAGDIISTIEVAIGPDMDYGELEEALCIAGSNLLLETIHKIENGTAGRYAQDSTLATMAPKIELEDCRINWNLSSKRVHNLVRGVNPEPGAWCQVTIKETTKRLKIIKTTLGSRQKELGKMAGEILEATDNGILVACGDGTLYLQRVQLEGKKAMSALEFFRGNALRYLQ